jgi:hypothetical protein
MDVRPVDPRDTGWEITSPSYRVYFWEAQPPPPGAQDDAVGYRSSEFEITGADVAEVLAWAEATAAGESSFTLYGVIEHGGERGLVRLAGIDPTAPESSI